MEITTSTSMSVKAADLPRGGAMVGREVCMAKVPVRGKRDQNGSVL
jgi:hypothetical protein